MKISDPVHLLASGSLGTGTSPASDCHVYGIDCGDGFVLMDAGVGQNSESLLANLVQDGIEPARVSHVLLTHGHLDHSGGARYLRDEFKLKVGASHATVFALEAGNEQAISLDQAKAAGGYPQDFRFQASPVDQPLADGQKLQFETGEVEVIATPGHSHDMLSFLFRTDRTHYLFTGDTLFAGGKILLPTVYDCSVQDYAASLRKLERYEFDGLSWARDVDLQGWLQTDYSDGSLRAAKTLTDFGSPRSNAGEGLGVRGRAHGGMFFGGVPKPSSRAGFRQLIQQRGIPLTPSPSPALGRGEPILRTVHASEQSTHTASLSFANLNKPIAPKMKNIALSGTGNIGRVHLRNLLSLRGCRVTGVFDTAPRILEEVLPS